MPTKEQCYIGVEVREGSGKGGLCKHNTEGELLWGVGKTVEIVVKMKGVMWRSITHFSKGARNRPLSKKWVLCFQEWDPN